MLVIGDVVSRWVAGRLGIRVNVLDTAGIGWEVDGTIVVGAAFYGYTGHNMYIHVAGVPGHRMTPTFIATIMDYPFNQAGVRRLTGLIPSKNPDGIMMATRLGGVLEGRMVDALKDDDLLIYGLTRKNAERWLTAPYQRRIGARYGKKLSVTAPTA